MGDVLSQNEIDALLNALSSGELDVDEIKSLKTYLFDNSGIIVRRKNVKFVTINITYIRKLI